jgi:hypothetical protein
MSRVRFFADGTPIMNESAKNVVVSCLIAFVVALILNLLL